MRMNTMYVLVNHRGEPFAVEGHPRRIDDDGRYGVRWAFDGRYVCADPQAGPPPLVFDQNRGILDGCAVRVHDDDVAAIQSCTHEVTDLEAKLLLARENLRACLLTVHRRGTPVETKPLDVHGWGLAWDGKKHAFHYMSNGKLLCGADAEQDFAPSPHVPGSDACTTCRTSYWEGRRT